MCSMNRDNAKFYMLAFLAFLCMVAIAVTPFPVHAAELPDELPSTSQETPPPEEPPASVPDEPPSSTPAESSSVPDEPLSSTPEESSSVPAEPSSSTPTESSSIPEISSSIPEVLPLEPVEPIPPTIEEQTFTELSALRQNSDVFLYIVIPIIIAVLLIYKLCLWFYCTFIKSAL